MKRITIILLLGSLVLPLYAQVAKLEKKADKYFFEQQYFPALNTYNEILSANANHDRAKYQAELCSLLVKDFRDKPLNTILGYAGTQGKSDRFYDYWLGRIYMSRYRFEEAITAFNAFLNLDSYKSPELIDSTNHYIDRAKRSIESYNNPKLYELERVSSEINGSGSQLTAVFFPPTNQMIYTDHTRPDNDITVYISRLTGDNNWSKPQVLTALGKIENDDYDIEFLPPSRLLYKKERTIEIFNFQNDSWGTPTPYIVKLQVKNKHSHFTINSDEDLMIISEKDFLGRFDLYQSIKSGSEWSKPVFIESINSPLDEHSPFLTEDSQTLYFSSEGHDALGGHDIFYAKREGNTWGEPVNLGHPINTFDDELYFSINEDGKTGFLSSDRMSSNGGFDIYRFEEAAFRPITGTVVADATGDPVDGLRIEYKPTKFPDETFISYTDENGNYRSEIIVGDIMNVKIFENEDLIYEEILNETFPSAETPAKKDFEVVTVDSKVSLSGALADSENPDFAKEAYADIDFIANEFRPGNKALLKDLYFAYASSEVDKGSEETLSVLLMVLKDNPQLRIEIAAHTDHVGSRAFNQNLSEQRAGTVYNYLVKNGIEGSRLRAKGYGEMKPVGSNENDEGRALNRRIEIIVIE